MLKSGGRLIFDLIEERRQTFENDKLTYLRFYSREEISEVLEHVGYRLMMFAQVRHAPDFERLLVVAEKCE